MTRAENTGISNNSVYRIMYTMWEDFRDGGDNDNGQWQVQFCMSGQYIGSGNIWIESNGDYNTVYTSNLIQAVMPYGKNGGIE